MKNERLGLSKRKKKDGRAEFEDKQESMRKLKRK